MGDGPSQKGGRKQGSGLVTAGVSTRIPLFSVVVLLFFLMVYDSACVSAFHASGSRR